MSVVALDRKFLATGGFAGTSSAGRRYRLATWGWMYYSEPQFEVEVKVNGVVKSNIEVREISMSILQHWEAKLFDPTVRHDETSAISQNDLIEISHNKWASKLFKGWVRMNEPRGISQEGIEFKAVDARYILEREIPCRINGWYFWQYNKNGSWDASAPSYGYKNYWTVGQALCDVIEHAMGNEWNTIPRHHDSSTDVTDTYLDDETYFSQNYPYSDILTLDQTLPEFNINGSMFGEVVTRLLEIQGDCGWYINPDNMDFELVKLTASTAIDVEAGELGHWVDEAGKDYKLINNQITLALDGVYTYVTISGRDKVEEAKPSKIQDPAGVDQDGIGDARLMPAWDPSLESTWSQTKWDNGDYDGDGTYEYVWRLFKPRNPHQRKWVCTTGAGSQAVINESPQVYSGTLFYGDDDNGNKYQVDGTNAGTYAVFPEQGIVMFWEPLPSAYRSKKFYAWYKYQAPFTVTVGPDGDAYDNYGYEGHLALHNEEYEHSTSRWPVSDTDYHQLYMEERDDTTVMTEYANNILSRSGNEVMGAEVEIDGIDVENYTLKKKINFANLAKWSSVGLQIYHIRILPHEDKMILSVANRVEGVTVNGLKWAQKLSAERNRRYRERMAKWKAQNLWNKQNLTAIDFS